MAAPMRIGTGGNVDIASSWGVIVRSFAATSTEAATVTAVKLEPVRAER